MCIIGACCFTTRWERYCVEACVLFYKLTGMMLCRGDQNICHALDGGMTTVVETNDAAWTLRSRPVKQWMDVLSSSIYRPASYTSMWGSTCMIGVVVACRLVLRDVSWRKRALCCTNLPCETWCGTRICVNVLREHILHILRRRCGRCRGRCRGLENCGRINDSNAKSVHSL